MGIDYAFATLEKLFAEKLSGDLTLFRCLDLASPLRADPLAGGGGHPHLAGGHPAAPAAPQRAALLLGSIRWALGGVGGGWGGWGGGWGGVGVGGDSVQEICEPTDSLDYFGGRFAKSSDE